MFFLGAPSAASAGECPKERSHTCSEVLASVFVATNPRQVDYLLDYNYLFLTGGIKQCDQEFQSYNMADYMASI